jgi:2,3-diketo-5-methylthiopentyl-1-phosphate enolase
MNRFFSSMLNPSPEGVDLDDMCVGTYLVRAGKGENPVIKAQAMSVEQTTGSWADVKCETDEIRAKYAGKVLGIYEVPDYELQTHMEQEVADGEMRDYIFRIAFPVANIEDNIPLLLATITGNITAEPYVRLLDIDFGKNFTKRFKGPKFGIEGIRNILGVKERPLLNNMIKPCTGYTPDIGAELFYEAAVGGVDIIKDDELIGGDRSFNKIEDRVRMNMDAAARAEKVKKEKTIYTVNITDEIYRLKDNALRAIKAGVNGLMVDTFAVGLSALRMLAEDPEITVPILSHCCYSGAQYSSPLQGVSSLALNKLSRLCGADTLLIVPPYAKFDSTFGKYIRNITICTSKFGHLKTSLPFIGGGVICGLVPTLLDDAGNDVLLGVGAGIHGHPMGPTAGATAFRQAIDATMKGVSLREAAKSHKELQVAIDKWGVFGEDNLKKNYAI